VLGGSVSKYTKGITLIVIHSFTQTVSQAATIIIQQNSTLLHFSGHVMEVLNVVFYGKYIGRGGSVLWPLRSPRLTVLDVSFGNM
jgi:hypothetical protein